MPNASGFSITERPRAASSGSSGAFARFAAIRELGPQNIHVAHLVIDSGVNTEWVRERIRERGPRSAR
jgi:hypothetical protein